MLLHSSSTGFRSDPEKPPCCCFQCDCGASETLEENTNPKDWTPAEITQLCSFTELFQQHSCTFLWGPSWVHYPCNYRKQRVRCLVIGRRLSEVCHGNISDLVTLADSFCSKRIRVRPASVGHQWRFLTAARCWTRTEWSVRWGAEEETAPANTS